MSSIRPPEAGAGAFREAAAAADRRIAASFGVPALYLPQARPVALDLFCGQGGMGKGYLDAGLAVHGIDSDPGALRHYPGPRTCADWREGLDRFLPGADFIHASPVCKAYSTATRVGNRAGHPDQVAEVREALQATGLPYVIENVPGSPLSDPVELCGCMFGLSGWYRGRRFQVYRPRLFETGGGFSFSAPPHFKEDHVGLAVDVFGHGAPGRFYRDYGFGIPASFAKEVMGVPWMTRDGMSQSVPPAFTRYVGEQFLAAHRAWARQ